jgi:hypothetical protein
MSCELIGLSLKFGVRELLVTECHRRPVRVHCHDFVEELP